MAKAPEQGRVKMRLAQDIGSAAALEVYQQLLSITAAVAAQWPGPVLLTSAGDETHFAKSPVASLLRVQQPDGGLGVRIAAALRAGLSRSPATIVIGSDCPGLQIAALHAVTALLAEVPVAFGPATDGGFWSIASRSTAVADAVQCAPITWSAADTLLELRRALDKDRLTSRLGPPLADCDTLADLRLAIAEGLLPPLPLGEWEQRDER